MVRVFPETEVPKIKVQKGRHNSPATQFKKGQPAWNKGLKFSEATRRNMSISKTGIKLPPFTKEHRDKIGRANWRGTTSERVRIRKRTEYAEWRTKVFKRDNWMCQDCGARGVRIEADHIKPFAQFPKLRLKVSNGRTLCKPCHKKRHAKRATTSHI